MNKKIIMEPNKLCQICDLAQLSKISSNGEMEKYICPNCNYVSVYNSKTRELVDSYAK